MGYSITAACRDRKTQQKMTAFLQTNYTDGKKLFGLQFEYSSEPRTDLAYCHKRFQIGFDYNSSVPEPERCYKYALTRWIALRACKPKIFKGHGKILPWYNYDSQEDVPIIPEGTKVSDDFQKMNSPPCNPDGWIEHENPDYAAMRIRRGLTEAHKTAIKAELKRLSELWTAQQP